MVTVKKEDVKDFWSKHPLGSYEIKEKLGSQEYFDQFDLIRNASSYFVMDFYKFKESKNQRILDVGCGPGWITHKYADNGADIYSLDLTFTAVTLARKNLARDGQNSRFVVADAEHIPYKDGSFDFVSCDGVLHHTPGTEKGVAQIYRVLRKEGRAAISFYYENILLRRGFLSVTKFLMRLLGVKTHGVKKISFSVTKEELGNLYDGVDNPLGRIYSRKNCEKMLEGAGFKIIRSKVYYFPKRFFPFHNNLPFWLYRILDKFFGTMIFFEVEK
jgi:ubiquinone/menaquinone biosynthesis C-methylase UbiE